MSAVVVTGAGLVSPAGAGLGALRAALQAGRVCLAPLPSHVARDLPLGFGGRVPPEVDPPDPRQRAVALGRLAIAEALGTAPPPLDRTSLALGSGLGTMERTERALSEGVPSALAPLHPHALTCALAEAAGLGGPRRTFAVTCVSGLFALEQALLDLRLARAEATVVVGLETLSRTIQAGFCALEALSRTAGPDHPSPTDGIVLGEGACALLLEDEEQARSRGARALAHLLGQGIRADAVHLTSPATAGVGMRAAIAEALGDRAPADVARAAPPAPASPAYRELYDNALRPLLGADWERRAATWEGTTGHLLGASGPLGVAHLASLLAPGELGLALTVGFGGLNGATLVGAP